MEPDALAEMRRIARELGGLLTDLSRRVERIESGSRATQLGHSSIETGALLLGKRGEKHVQAGPFGIRQFSDAGNLTMAVGAGSVTGGNFLTVIDDNSGMALAAIDQQGTVTATDFQAQGAAYFEGTLLPDVIDGRLVGDLVAHHTLTTPTIVTTSSIGLNAISFDTGVESYYDVFTSPVRMLTGSGDPVTSKCVLNLHSTTDGTTPSISSPIVARDYGRCDESLHINALIHTPGAVNLRLLLSVTSLTPTQGCKAEATATTPVQLFAKRAGRQLVPSNGGPSDGGGTGGTPEQTFTRQYISQWARTFDGSGVVEIPPENMVQGTHNDGRGAWRSLFGFDYQDIADDLQGAEIEKVLLYVYARWWENNDGGFVRLGTSSLKAPPGNNIYPNNVPAGRVVWKLPKPGGIEKDIGITIGEGFRDGTIGSFVLDATDVPPNPADNGIFAPGATSPGNRPYLKITYRK